MQENSKFHNKVLLLRHLVSKVEVTLIERWHNSTCWCRGNPSSIIAFFMSEMDMFGSESRSGLRSAAVYGALELWHKQENLL